MDGYEVARRIRLLPNAKTMLVAALTGYGLEDDRQRARAAVFDLHLVTWSRLGIWSHFWLQSPRSRQFSDRMDETHQIGPPNDQSHWHLRALHTEPDRKSDAGQSRYIDRIVFGGY
jgi:hypothetical protein